jgi:hypothetical protein
MQKVRYCLSFNSLYIKFQVLFIVLLFKLFTFHSHYSSLSILNFLVFEIGFSFFNYRISFYNLLNNYRKIHCSKKKRIKENKNIYLFSSSSSLGPFFKKRIISTNFSYVVVISWLLKNHVCRILRFVAFEIKNFNQ